MNTTLLNTDDTTLIELAKQGDEPPFTELARRYKQMIYNFSFNVCHNKDYAEEIVQDTFVNVFRKISQYNGEAKFSTWLYSIVVNNCQMHNRQSKLQLATISVDEFDDGETELDAYYETVMPSPEDEMISKEFQDAFDKAVLKLPIDYRLPFVLRDIEKVSSEEAAVALNISVAALKSRLHRARLFMREELKKFKP